MFHKVPSIGCAFDFSVFGQRNHVREEGEQPQAIPLPFLPSLFLLSADFFFAQTRVYVVGSLGKLDEGGNPGKWKGKSGRVDWELIP